ncbi:hypothetical protein BD770DRAFT_407086 [Pilaira anomala]|nr:hypothetical protein BD770DRAFT_407086 [Pilaira anomala]
MHSNNRSWRREVVVREFFLQLVLIVYLIMSTSNIAFLNKITGVYESDKLKYLIRANVKSKESSSRGGQTTSDPLGVFRPICAKIVQNFNQWEEVTPINPANIVTRKRKDSQAAVAPDGERLLIQGGLNSDGKPMVHQAIVYNFKDNSWEIFAKYNYIRNGGDR